jgi:hypothetical protein
MGALYWPCAAPGMPSMLLIGRRCSVVRARFAQHPSWTLQVSGSESDPELHAKQQAALFACALRTMALPLGRGALMMGLAQPLPGALGAMRCAAARLAQPHTHAQAMCVCMLARLLHARPQASSWWCRCCACPAWCLARLGTQAARAGRS